MNNTQPAMERLYNAIAKEMREVFLIDVPEGQLNDEVCLVHGREQAYSYTLLVTKEVGRSIDAYVGWTDTSDGEPIRGHVCKSYNWHGIDAAQDEHLQLMAQQLLGESDMYGVQDWYWWCTSLKIEFSRQLGIQLGTGVMQRTAWHDLIMVMDGETHRLVVLNDHEYRRYKVTLTDKSTGDALRCQLDNREPTDGVIEFMQSELK